MIHALLTDVANLTDRLEHIWENYVMKRAAGSILVVTYLVMIVVIEFERRGFLPAPLSGVLPDTHFFAVEIAFTLLLITEVVSLIFGLTRSFSRSIGIQLEILSLILLRDTFKQFTDFGEPLQWELVTTGLDSMVADVLGALAIFVVLGIYYRIQRSLPITRDEGDQAAFITYKKLIALGLIFVFAFIGILDAGLFLSNQETYPFFDTFYTVLIFTDVLMVLLSLRYSTNFAVTFRNFGFAVVTVFIRVSLIAPTPLNAVIGVATALFALAMSLAYNHYGPVIARQAYRDHSMYDTKADEGQEEGTDDKAQTGEQQRLAPEAGD